MNRHQRRAAGLSRPQPKAPPRVALCVPSMDTWMADTAMAFGAAMAVAAARYGIIPINQKSSYIHQARNMIADIALNQAKAEWLMWFDADMVWPPETLEILMAHGKDIVGTDYRRRKPPFSRIGHFVGEDPGPDGKGLHEMSLLPHGVLLVRAEVYRRLNFPWYELRYLSPHHEGLDGEDAFFCRNAREAGFKIWCDLDLTKRVSHIGERAVGYQAGGGAF